MQRDFNNRDFEQFVKQNADQYRMFPSEKVWQGINGALHTRRRWYGFGLALLLLLTGTAVTLVMVSTPANKQGEKTTASLHSGETENSPSAPTAQKSSKPAPAVAEVKPLIITTPLLNQPEAIFPSKPGSTERTIEPPVNTPGSPASSFAATIAETPATATVQRNSAPVSPQQSQADIAIVHSGITHALLPGNNSSSVAEVERPKQSVTAIQQQDHTDIYPLTIESVINSYKSSTRKKRLTLQFHLAPTISYRKLSENKKFLQSAADNGTIPVYAGYANINNYVSHKPDMGLELGFTGKYALSEQFKLRAGVQFNVSRYDIKAAYDQQRDTATIALDDATYGVNQTIRRQTNYRNSTGNNANWLKNLYYSVSLPIGAELTFKSRSNTQFGIAATFQPTYIIKDRAYLISTDYKNYVEVPSLVRKLNMNASFETFVAYSTGNINWQIGPQIRYQLQSSFKKKYPFKENLFDFGLRVGIQLNR